MKKFDVVLALSKIREANALWTKQRLAFNSDVDDLLRRLLHEAAHNFMSVEEVSKASGFTPKRVRELMRRAGLNPKDGKRLLSKKAAEALANNSALLGIEPGEMDLMSPLAYLPMGEQLKRQLHKTVSQVHELPVEGYADIDHAIHDLHLRGGRLRYDCPLCGRTPEVSGNDELATGR